MRLELNLKFLMKAKFQYLFSLLTLLASVHQAFAQGTAFTYQGQLNSSGSPANGNYDFTFALFNNSSTNSGQVGGTLTNLDVGVTNGLFIVTLDFGAVFAGNATWLAIGVRTNGGSSFTALNPLQEVTPTPYAIYAPSAGSAASANSVAAMNISGTLPLATLPAAILTNNETGVNLPQLTGSNVTLRGTFAGSGIITNSVMPFLITNGSSYATISNAFATGGLIEFQAGDYFSVSNLVPANNTTVHGNRATLHFAPSCTNFLIDCFTNVTNFSMDNIRLTGDAFANFASASFIFPYLRGAGYDFIPWYIGQTANTYTNRSGLRVNAGGGGLISGVQCDGFGAYGFFFDNPNPYNTGTLTVCDGNVSVSNYCGVMLPAWAFDFALTPGSTSGWVANANPENQLITGWTISANGIGIYASAGDHNIVGCAINGNELGIYLGNGGNSSHGTIIGNTVNHNNYGVVVYQTEEALRDNTFLSDNELIFDQCVSAVFENNQIAGNGTSMTILCTNASGVSGAGQVTIDNNFYSGNWGDSSSGVVLLTNMGAGNAGNVVYYGNWSYDNGTALNCDGSAASLINMTGNGSGLTNLNASQLISGTIPDTLLPPNVALLGANQTFQGQNVFTANVGIGNSNPTNNLMVVNARCDGSSWINASDRNLKQDFAAVDAQAVLEKVAALPVRTWSYKLQPGQKHLGPVAQDFHAAFGLGMDDVSISTVDEGGVALAAIQGLNQKLNEKDAEIQELKQSVDELKKVVQSLTEKKQGIYEKTDSSLRPADSSGQLRAKLLD